MSLSAGSPSVLPQRPIHQELAFYRGDSKLLFVPKITFSKDSRCLIVDRAANAHSLEQVAEADFGKYSTVAPILVHGILGISQLFSGPYICLITGKVLVGLIEGESIFKITEVQFVPILASPAAISDSKRKQEAAFLAEMTKLITDKYNFFSYSFDLSNTLQRKELLKQDELNVPLYKRFDHRFFWNRVILDPLIRLDYAEWILPVLRGNVQIFISIIQRRSFDLLLISRRSRFRAGTRYKTRGVDATGSVANYVETEQLVCMDKQWLSFVQTRGSIPLLWGQSGVKYTPVPKISPDGEANWRCFNLHFTEQLSLYSGQVIVNLLDQKGVEAELSSAWEAFVKRLADPNVKFEAFDFHSKCKSSYDNVSELVDKLRPDLEGMGIFHMDGEGQVLTRQTGVVRTNCLDCLDRTNLVQSFFGRYALAHKLRLFGIDYFDSQNVILERIFKEAWANNGDAVSLQYAGTAALKSDFTRTGQRETKGVLKDGVNSLSRYWMNAFKDNMRQLGIDLFLGIYDLISTKHDDVDDDIVSQSGLWNEQQLQAIEACTTYLEQEILKNIEEEDILNAYVVISVNKFGAEQERVLAVTNKAVYRFKYNYNSTKSPIDHFKRMALTDLKGVMLGPLASDKKQQQFGIVLNFGDAEKKPHIYAALDLTRENADRIVEAIAKAVKSTLQTDIVVQETAIQKQASFGSGLFNALGLGMYNKGKKDDRSARKDKESPEVTRK